MDDVVESARIIELAVPQKEAGSENVKLKAVFYLIIGLVFNILGLVVGSLWIKFKAKTNRKTKFVALITGFGIYVLFSYVVSPYFLQPRAEKLLYSKFPEMLSVKTAVENKYTNGKVGLGARWNMSTSNGEKITTTSLIVQYHSKEQLTTKEMQEMGKLVCTVLQSAGKKYDNVGILTVKSFLPIDIPFVYFNKTFSINATCEEWITKDFSKIGLPL